MNLGETIIKEIGNESEPNEKSIGKGIWKSVERKRERRVNAIGKKTVALSRRNLQGSLKNTLPNFKKSGDVRTAMQSTRDVESSDEQTATL